MEDQLEGFHTTFDVDKEDVLYSDEGFNEVIVNFVRIETFYLKCYSSFLSKLKLYKDIKAKCVGEALPSFST